jgi:hypothetical protein
LSKVGNNVTISFTTPQPYSQHLLQQSSNLKIWQNVAAPSFQPTGGNNVRVTTDSAANCQFYRLILMGL